MRRHFSLEPTILETGNTQLEAPGQPANATEQKALNKDIQKAGAKVLVPHLIIKVAGLFANYYIPNHYSLAIAEVFKVINDSVLNVAFLIGEQCLAPSYLPLFSRAKNENGEARAWRYTSILFNLQLIILLAVVAAFAFFPETFVDLLTDYKGIDPEKVARRDIFVKMLPFAAPGLIGMSLASLTYVILNAHKEFFFAAFGDSVLKLSIVGGAMIGVVLKSNDWRYIAGGAVAGGTLKLATHLFALGFKRIRNYTLTLDLSDTYVKAFFVLVLPLLLGVLISQGREQIITKVLTSQTNLKLYFGNGRNLVDTIQFIVPYTLSIALLPFFCDLSARSDNARLGAVLTQIIRILIWVFVPVGIVLAAAALPMSKILYQGPKYTDESLGFTAHVSRLYAMQLPFAAIEMMVMQAFFSSKRVIAPTIVGFVFSALSAGTAYVCVENGYVTTPLGILTLVPLCLIVARIVKSMVLVTLLRWSVPVLPVLETVSFAVRLLIAGVAAGAAAVGASRLNFGEGRPRQMALAAVIGVAGFTAFLAVSLALKMDEPKEFWHWTMEKFKRRGAKSN
ncbi:MAG: lipid II flippase MurJ [Planctomycetota bacterium]